jgi:hypothetical protein
VAAGIILAMREPRAPEAAFLGRQRAHNRERAMNHIDLAAPGRPRFVLRFRPLRAKGCSLAFPCNDRGCVDLDALGDGLLRSYLYARAVVGAEFARPSVEMSAR